MMLRKISLILAFVLTFCGGVAAAGSLNGEYNGNPIVKVLAGGKTLTDEVPAQIIDGKTMVPLTMLRDLGAKVDWNGATYTVDVTMPEKVKAVVPKFSHEQLNVLARSVGRIYAYNGDAYVGQGSGFMLRDNVFVTVCHLGCAADKLRIQLDGKEYTVTDYLFKDESKDIYAVKLNADVPALAVSKEVPKSDEIIHTIGYPHGKFSIDDGAVYLSHEYKGSIKIEHSAHTQAGSSGGAIFNDSGEAVGITSSGSPIADDMNTAISIKHVLDALAGINKR